MKTLNDLLSGLKTIRRAGAKHESIRQICFDSRRAGEGDLFVALIGSQFDGHQYIDQSVGAGVKVVVCQNWPEHLQTGVCYLQVEDSHLALSQLAANYYEHPSQELKLIGITGTNGKTTSVTLLYELFKALGHKAGLISTIRYLVDEQEQAATHTTPDALRLQELLRQMADGGCEFAFMEVSSHALAQQRTAKLHFSGAVFTNITHDHLDYHGSFDAYIKTKKSFFDHLPKDAFALTNLDDPNGTIMLQNCQATHKSYALKQMADFQAKLLEQHIDGSLLAINGQEVWSRFIGEFNAYNLLVCYAVASLLGKTAQEILAALSAMRPVEGRFETIRSAQGITGIVDYAHTPDALHNVLTTINKLKQLLPKTATKQAPQIITVVGAGGDRDKAKRPVMARVAAKLSDKVILTSDNPRGEAPEAILKDMQKGIEASQQNMVLTITDRREAIRTACMLAQKGDIVLVAGKGHESYQEVKGKRHHFDDREVIREVFAD